jgi:site-specific DNA-methyltransferase (adenine-specific)
MGGFKLQNTFHWVKSISIPQVNQSFGHFKPINSKRFVNDCHEYIFHFTRNGDVKLDRLAIGVEYQDKTNILRWDKASNGIRCRGNTWFIPYDTIQNRKKDRPHPASFPIELPKMCMTLHGATNINLALDPFLGIGTSALAAKQLGLNFIGFEIDSKYYKESQDRINNQLVSVDS